jgi:hypothetical protein
VTSSAGVAISKIERYATFLTAPPASGTPVCMNFAAADDDEYDDSLI